MNNVTREQFVRFVPISTRWMDNDAYGHVNNVVYYSFFDTAVNQTLIELELLEILQSAQIGVVVSTSCEYFAPISFPDKIEVGVRVDKLGTTSVTYALAVFKVGHSEARALGQFVHVYVDRASRQPAPIPPGVRAALQQNLMRAN
jgi:acyl-CoA thioester hydrolase